MKKTWLKLTTLAIITVIIMYFLLKDDFASIFYTLLNANLIYIILLLLVVLLGDISKSISISLLAKKVVPKYNYKNGFSLIIKTNFFNGITPFSLGGQPFELYSLKKTNNIDYIEGADILFEDFYTYQMALMIITIIFMIVNAIFNLIVFDVIAKNIFIIGFIINIVIALFLIFILYINIEKHRFIAILVNIMYKLKIIKNKDSVNKKILDNLNKFKMQVKNIRKDAFTIFKCIILNIVKLLSIGMVLYLSLKAIGCNVSIIICVMCSIFITTMVSFVPIPGASGGVEYSFALLLTAFVASTELLTALIIWRFMTYYLPIIVGGIVFLIEDGKKI